MALAAYPNDPNRLLAAGYVETAGKSYLGVFLSRNSGTDWTQVKILNENGSWADSVALAPSDVGTIFVSGTSYPSYKTVFFRSANGGSSWTQVAAPCETGYIYSIAVHPSLKTTLYAASSWNGIHKSTNGGNSWAKLASGPNGGNCVVINSANPNEVFVGGSNGVFYSANGGATWSDLSAGLPAKYVTSVVIDGAARQVYAGTSGGGICRRSF